MRNAGAVDPGRKLAGRVGATPFEVRAAGENLARREPFEIVHRERSVRPAAHEELAGRDVQERTGARPAVEADPGKVVRPVLIEHLQVADRSRRHDPRDLPAHQPPGLRRILDLIAHGDLVARVEQPGDVGVDRVVGHPAHRRLAGGSLLPRGEGDIEYRCGGRGVLEEQLEEVAHPVQQNRVRVVGLDRQVVPEHRREGGDVPGRPSRSTGGCP